ncbi:hypothetical protein SNEBB_004282 [Seison nebaliae]|nr:hypothetical protein SNEBB_004282 [Seison nebaliae]
MYRNFILFYIYLNCFSKTFSETSVYRIIRGKRDVEKLNTTDKSWERKSFDKEIVKLIKNAEIKTERNNDKKKLDELLKLPKNKYDKHGNLLLIPTELVKRLDKYREQLSMNRMLFYAEKSTLNNIKTRILKEEKSRNLHNYRSKILGSALVDEDVNKMKNKASERHRVDNLKQKLHDENLKLNNSNELIKKDLHNLKLETGIVGKRLAAINTYTKYINKIQEILNLYGRNLENQGFFNKIF